jgi:hypothetical protein
MALGAHDGARSCIGGAHTMSHSTSSNTVMTWSSGEGPIPVLGHRGIFMRLLGQVRTGVKVSCLLCICTTEGR